MPKTIYNIILFLLAMFINYLFISLTHVYIFTMTNFLVFKII